MTVQVPDLPSGPSLPPTLGRLQRIKNKHPQDGGVGDGRYLISQPVIFNTWDQADHATPAQLPSGLSQALVASSHP